MKAVFIDRDGTLGGGDKIEFPNEFSLFDGTIQALKNLKDSGFKIIAFTNQPDISRGLITKDEFEKELYSFGFDDVCICPHTLEDNCECRKPKTAMLEIMVEKYLLNINESYVIGDRWSDMKAGQSMGMKIILVRTGAGEASINKYKDKWDIENVDFIASNFVEASEHIKGFIDTKMKK